MTRYVLSREAVLDIEEITHHLLTSAGPDVALKILGEIRSAARLLSRMPGLGHSRVDLTDEAVRFWRVLSYLIVYDPIVRPVAIARIIHSRRDIRRVLRSTI